MELTTDKFGAKTITETVNGNVIKITYHCYTEAKAIESFKESVKNVIEADLKKTLA